MGFFFFVFRSCFYYFIFGWVGGSRKTYHKRETVHKESEARVSGRAAGIQRGCNTEFKEGSGETSRAPRGPLYNLNLYRPHPLNEVTALNAQALPGFLKKNNLVWNNFRKASDIRVLICPRPASPNVNITKVHVSKQRNHLWYKNIKLQTLFAFQFSINSLFCSRIQCHIPLTQRLL